MKGTSTIDYKELLDKELLLIKYADQINDLNTQLVAPSIAIVSAYIDMRNYISDQNTIQSHVDWGHILKLIDDKFSG